MCGGGEAGGGGLKWILRGHNPRPFFCRGLDTYERNLFSPHEDFLTHQCYIFKNNFHIFMIFLTGRKMNNNDNDHNSRHHLVCLASIDVFWLFFHFGLVIGEVTCSLKLEGIIFSELVKMTFEGIQGGCYDCTCRQGIPQINDTLCEEIGSFIETGSLLFLLLLLLLILTDDLLLMCMVPF